MWQHQQRSSMDTEDLDKECLEQDIRPKLAIEKSPNKLKVPNTLQVITKQSSSCLRIGQPRTMSPSRRRKVSEFPQVLAESPLPAVVPELVLARTDSCKTNTDLSESTTTDDYITANSGTDSSRKSASFQGADNSTVQHVLQDPKLQLMSQDKKPDGGGSSFDSAKGSLDAFTLDDMVVPSISPSISSDRYLPMDTNPASVSYSHTPVPQIRTGRSTPSEDSSSCGSYSVGGSTPDLLESLTKREETTPKRRKEFQLDLANGSRSGSSSKTRHKNNDSKPSPQQESLKVAPEKGKRSKVRTRSPLQGHKKSFQGRKSPHKDKTLYLEDRSYKATSDESSTGREYTISQTSPRKSKKNKESSRRKSLPRSPVSQKSQKKNDVDYQPSSLPGSLSRRKSAKKSAQPGNLEYKHANAYSKHADAQKSPTASAKDTTTLKALSAESLRSVSPGSDSVFYSEPNSHATDHHMHCLHCGKEVEVNTDEAEKSLSSNGHQQQVIVQPPAGFEDSPKIKVGRLFKKSDKRLKSEEKSQHEQKRHRYRPDMRAKSEERGGATATLRGRLRPMQRSPYCSKEHLKAADSSPSILPGAPEEDNDQGVYPGCYRSGQWFCINEADKVLAFFSPTEPESVRRDSISSTESEHNFSERYHGVAHRVVHRKPYVDMYKRLYFKSFESDKTIVVQRDSDEFGFRIHGSKPVVVTVIEPNTPAESSGLEVGDIIISVNGVNVLDRSHSDVVQIAHAGSDTLTLEVARTSYALNSAKELSDSYTLYSGYLWKMSGYAKGNTTNKWTRRWFCLKKDNCLYYYKTDSDKQPVGVVMLFDQEIRELDTDTELSKPNKFVIQKEEAVPLYLAADTLEARSRWVEVIEKTLSECQAVDEYLEETKRNLTLSPNSISDPDCFGYLIKLGTQWKSWSRRYCVLKDAALYFYQDSNASNAFGVALLQGYRVQQSSSSKKHSFEIVPPDPTKKHYYFHAESDTDRRRWISALEYSIERWLVQQ
ncbi:hypothetical protein HUJ04_007586 [Dendroctonus ponderosae]|nr:hypothetical protein HUJ04_007586 [Dendroctonus ponderosae]